MFWSAATLIVLPSSPSLRASLLGPKSMLNAVLPKLKKSYYQPALTYCSWPVPSFWSR
jgi:hypothetical protein